MFGSASNTKNRSCGFSVEPISLCAVLEADGAAEPREALARRCRRRAPTGSSRGRPCRPTASPGSGPIRSAGPTRPRGVSDDERHDPVRADELRLRPHRLQRLPARSIRSPGRPARAWRRFETSTSNALGADVASRRRSRLNRLSGSGGSSPSIRRAPRDSQLREDLAVHELERLQASSPATARTECT